ARCIFQYSFYFPQPAAPPLRHRHSIFIGFPLAALTLLNRPRSVADRSRLEADVGRGLRKRKRQLHKFVCGGFLPRNLLRNRMPSSQPAKIASLYRYPVKGLSPEPLQSVGLGVGQTFPADRRYAIENGPSGFDPADPKW